MDEPVNPPVSPNPRENVVLIGTAHVSEKSVKEVEEAIERYRPDVVAVELDERRYRALLEGDQQKKEIQVKELLKGNNLFIFIIQWLLAFVQRKVGMETGVKPGSEMMAAIEAAKKNGLEVALIDRDIGITLARFWGKMTLREKFRMFYSLILASLGIGTKDVDIEVITQEDVVADLLEELRKFTPSVAEVLVDERDAYLAHNLLAIGRTKRVLGVVGAGHREGIRKYMERPETIPSIQSIIEVPKKRGINFLKLFSALIVLSVVAIFGLLILSGIPLEQLILALIILFLAQGVLSALFVAIVGGHPKSIATAFVLAWYGFLNPVLAVGWLAGIVEAAERPPSMKDLNTLLSDDEDEGIIDMLKGMWANNLVRVIMVAAMANIGSMVGTVVGAAILVYYFHLTDPVGLLQAGVSNGYHAITSWLGTLF
ncbi:TraB family protein [Methanocella sp. CWC-04]|uniref:TraB family protein n=1 Tax=Methanooceanicella nereidis TaxID=2052831 RepID=A0AAP2RGQ0_9EURY|nr:TraB/GumN family protein [Methanocella sp. CWC-04]MCD1295907.1 TraB family protein [Methanocella sp. CWC-04]